MADDDLEEEKPKKNTGTKTHRPGPGEPTTETPTGGAALQPSSDPAQAGVADIYGGKYRFSAVTDPERNVEGYTASGQTGALPDQGEIQKALAGAAYKGESADVPQGSEFDIGGKVGDPSKLTDKEYDQLTAEAAKGNKLAQQILVRGHYKAQNFPSLTQDLNKVEDPFVSALSNMPNVASQAEAGTVAATQPYDFSNAESQVNNILANQGYEQLAKPSAQTSSYVGKLDQIASGNPLSESALGLPSINQALGGLGPAAKLSEKAAPNAALLAALLSHIQYEDVYGTGLGTSQSSQNPAWLQQVIAAVTGSALGGGLPSPSIASPSAGVLPSTSASPTGSNA